MNASIDLFQGARAARSARALRNLALAEAAAESYVEAVIELRAFALTMGDCPWSTEALAFADRIERQDMSMLADMRKAVTMTLPPATAVAGANPT